MYNISYRSLAEKFGEPTTTVFRNVNCLLKDFNLLLGPKFIKKPVNSEMMLLSLKFERYSKIQGTILAIDGTHISIDAPSYVPYQYINRKGWHSISVQLVCDNNCIIRDVFGGFPGCSHDAFLYNNSTFKNYVESSIPLPYFVIGDAAYPQHTHLVTPFKDTLTLDQDFLIKDCHHKECVLNES